MASGKCGDNLTWTLDDDGTLIEVGVTFVGNDVFKECIGLEKFFTPQVPTSPTNCAQVTTPSLFRIENFSEATA